MNGLNEFAIGMAGLIALWVLWFLLIKEQRVDMFREKLFELRDQLFDIAADGDLAYNHDAYTELRMLLNGMLRYAHRINLIGLVIAIIRSEMRTDRPVGYEKWELTLLDLPKGTQAKLRLIHEEMSKQFRKHLFNGSLVLSIFAFSMFVFYSARASWHRNVSAKLRHRSVHKLYERAVTLAAVRTHVRVLEADAYCSQKEDLLQYSSV
ncbi:MAG TPA: hypothetical protein VFN62_12265 [Acidobacteriaceae bacterium]|nr:hypothetical protein [Acidobacteriaceae bacterium]